MFANSGNYNEDSRTNRIYHQQVMKLQSVPASAIGGCRPQAFGGGTYPFNSNNSISSPLLNRKTSAPEMACPPKSCLSRRHENDNCNENKSLDAQWWVFFCLLVSPITVGRSYWKIVVSSIKVIVWIFLWISSFCSYSHVLQSFKSLYFLYFWTNYSFNDFWEMLFLEYLYYIDCFLFLLLEKIIFKTTNFNFSFWVVL